MRIRLIDPSHRLSQALVRLARRLKIRDTLYLTPLQTLRSRVAIIVANGSLDNQVALLLAHIFNGSEYEPIDIMFPRYKRMSSFPYIHRYVERGYEVVLLDQEIDDLENIYRGFKSKVHGRLESMKVDSSVNNRFAKAVLSTLRGRLHVLLVINGLDDARFTKHCIEDHLIVIAESMGKVRLGAEEVDTKSLWLSLSKRDQLDEFEHIKREGEDLVRRVFPQHVKAFEWIKRYLTS